MIIETVDGFIGGPVQDTPIIDPDMAYDEAKKDYDQTNAIKRIDLINRDLAWTKSYLYQTRARVEELEWAEQARERQKIERRIDRAYWIGVAAGITVGIILALKWIEESVKKY